MPHPVPLTSDLFSPADLELLLSPRRWRLVGSAFPPDSRPVRDAAHRKWARRHTDIHADREALFVLNGSGSLDFLGSTYRLGPGSVFFFDSMEPHDLGYPAWCAAAQHLWMTFIHDRCIIRLIDVGRGPRHYQLRWKRLFTLQAMGLSSQRDLFPADQRLELPAAVLHGRTLAAMALLMAGLAAQACRPQTDAAAARSSAFQRDVVEAIRLHIRQSKGKDCGLDNLARIAGYSKYHFLRLFASHTGTSLRAYIDAVRTDVFKQMVLTGTSQKNISFTLGFAHPSALCCWRRRHGL